MTLLEFLRTLDTRAISRLTIDPGPGRSTVTVLYASYTAPAPTALYPGEEELEPLRGPGHRADAVLRSHLRAPDTIGRIASEDLPAQIAALESSALLGGLHVERLGGGGRIVISAHAGTQAERNTWLRSLGSGKSQS
jgi:hypothetical protein